MVALLVRAARLRASRSRFSSAASSRQTSAGESLLFVACASRARSASAEARKPRARSASTGSLVVVIVASEVMGDHVTVDDVRGELERERTTRASASLLAEDGEGAVVVAALREQLLDGRGEHRGAVEVEQLARAPDEGADVAAVLEPEAEQLVDAGDLSAEPVTALAIARAGLL